LAEIPIIPKEQLILAYQNGIFPMSSSRYDKSFQWYEPRWRGIIPIDKFKISKNILKWIRNKPHRCTIDTAFREVILACADREETWISDIIIESYCNLFEHGYAHSVEIWVDNDLVGGLYGVHYQAAFFGETMFKRKPEMDKVALYYCWKILKNNHFMLWDTQFWTQHLAQFGCIEIPKKQYLNYLKEAMKYPCTFQL
jgi:leucyl/phenylalanyl-tRNA--protein transferase